MSEAENPILRLAGLIRDVRVSVDSLTACCETIADALNNEIAEDARGLLAEHAGVLVAATRL